MQIRTIKKDGIEIAAVNSEEMLINDVQSALDFMVTIQYETRCNRIILNKSAIDEEFFHLSTKIAGEILQKFVNYRVKFAVVGDFSPYTLSLIHISIFLKKRERKKVRKSMTSISKTPSLSTTGI